MLLLWLSAYLAVSLVNIDFVFEGLDHVGDGPLFLWLAHVVVVIMAKSHTAVAEGWPQIAAS
jgi:hypothetical protein